MAKQTVNIGATANDNTGDTIRVGGDKINDNFTELYDAKRFGIYDYNNTISAQSFTGATPIVLNNNGAGTFTYKNILTGVTDIFNTTTNAFDFSDLVIGDYFQIRVNLTVTTTSLNQNIEVTMDLAQGTASEYTITLKNSTYNI